MAFQCRFGQNISRTKTRYCTSSGDAILHQETGILTKMHLFSWYKRHGSVSDGRNLEVISLAWMRCIIRCSSKDFSYSHSLLGIYGAAVCPIVHLTRIPCQLPTGVPIAWMIASNTREVMIRLFLHEFKSRNAMIPYQILTDHDTSQINAVKAVYPSSKIFLCLWHLLRAWRQHIKTEKYLRACELLQKLPLAKMPQEFNQIWNECLLVAPQNTIVYIRSVYGE